MWRDGESYHCVKELVHYILARYSASIYRPPARICRALRLLEHYAPIAYLSKWVIVETKVRNIV